LGDFRGEERKGVQGNKIDGAGGVEPGQWDEEAHGSSREPH